MGLTERESGRAPKGKHAAVRYISAEKICQSASSATLFPAKTFEGINFYECKYEVRFFYLGPLRSKIRPLVLICSGKLMQPPLLYIH